MELGNGNWSQENPPPVCAVPDVDQKVLVSSVGWLETREEMKLTALLLHRSPSDTSSSHRDPCASTQPLKLLEMPAPLENEPGDNPWTHSVTAGYFS